MSTDELLDPRIARAERHDPDRVVRLLEPFVSERRRARLRDVIDRRIASVAVVLDAPYDPHNGAAVVRSCEAFGVLSLHVIEKKGYPFLVAGSVARGAQKWLDVLRHKSPRTVIHEAERQSFELVAAHPEGELAPEALGEIERVALVLGNEKEGISEELASRCTRRVRVPMRGFVESLNVSVTAAILVRAAVGERGGDLDEREKRRLYARGLYFSVPRADLVLEVGHG